MRFHCFSTSTTAFCTSAPTDCSSSESECSASAIPENARAARVPDRPYLGSGFQTNTEFVIIRVGIVEIARDVQFASAEAVSSVRNHQIEARQEVVARARPTQSCDRQFQALLRQFRPVLQCESFACVRVEIQPLRRFRQIARREIDLPCRGIGGVQQFD